MLCTPVARISFWAKVLHAVPAQPTAWSQEHHLRDLWEFLCEQSSGCFCCEEGLAWNCRHDTLNFIYVIWQVDAKGGATVSWGVHDSIMEAFRTWKGFSCGVAIHLFVSAKRKKIKKRHGLWGLQLPRRQQGGTWSEHHCLLCRAGLCGFKQSCQQSLLYWLPALFEQCGPLNPYYILSRPSMMQQCQGLAWVCCLQGHQLKCCAWEVQVRLKAYRRHCAKPGSSGRWKE